MHTADRQLLLEVLLHVADLSNCAKPFKFSKIWGERVVTEFFQQGDKEASIGLPVSPFTRRSPHALEQSQIAFIQHIVRPMMELVVQKVPETAHLLAHLDRNLKTWQELLKEALPPPE
jgi:3',5'-cyclic-nucleotide phosphodiesterase